MQMPDNVALIDQARNDNDKAWNEKKKERTRAQLLEAATRLIAERGIDLLTVNDVVTEAAVAAGTFYNYFASLEVLVDEVAAQLVTEIDQDNAQRKKARDPGSRMAQVLRAHFARARAERQWAILVVQFGRRDLYGVRDALLRGVEDDILEGIAKGQFSAEADEGAPDLVMGALLTGLRRVAMGHVGVDYDRNLTANILRGLGMVSAAALERAQRGI